MRLQSGLLVLVWLLGSALGPHVHDGDLAADGNTNRCTHSSANGRADARTDASSMR